MTPFMTSSRRSLAGWILAMSAFGAGCGGTDAKTRDLMGAGGGAAAPIAGTGGASTVGGSGGGSGPARVCVPGATQICVGPGACTGAQRCREDGQAWETCDCGAPVTGAGGAVVVVGTGGAP